MSLLLLHSGSGGTSQVLPVGVAFESESALSVTLIAAGHISYNVRIAPESETGLGTSGSIAPSKVIATITDVNGNPVVNQTSINWYWMDNFGGSIRDAGTDETTDGSGQIEITLPNTSRVKGQTGFLTVQLADGNVGIARETIV